MPEETPLVFLVLAVGGLLTAIGMAIVQIRQTRIRRAADRDYEARKAAERERKSMGD